MKYPLIILVGILFLALVLPVVNAAAYGNFVRSFPTGGTGGTSNPSRIATNGSVIIIGDSTNSNLYMYDMSGNFIRIVATTYGPWDSGIGWNGSNWFSVNQDPTSREITKYDANMTKIGNCTINEPGYYFEVKANGSNLFVQENYPEFKIKKLNYSCYVISNLSIPSTSYGFAVENSLFYLSYKNNLTIMSYTGSIITNYTLEATNQNNKGIDWSIGNLNLQSLYTVDSTTDKVYTYEFAYYISSIGYNLTSYDTNYDTYVLNITSDGTRTVTAVFYYDGIQYPTTKTGNNYEMSFISDLTQPSGIIGNKTFYWNISYGSDILKTPNYSQKIVNATLNLCNGTNGATYINFTFKDEETDNYINATFSIDDEWQYYFGLDSSIYKEFDFLNSSENKNYAFCLRNSNTTLHSNSVTYRYSASGYPQRLHTRSSDLTNSTTNQILYLLSTADGNYASFQVQNTNGAPISGVSVQAERQFDGSWTVVGLDETGDDGVVTFFVNPNYNHKLTFTKTNYDTQILTIKPTQSLYTVVLSGGIDEPIYYPDYIGINYKTSPAFGIVLSPNTIYGFTYNITSNKSNLVSYSFNLYDEGNNLLDTSSGSTSTGSNLTIYLNTSSYESIIGKYYYNIGNGTQQITLRTWTVLQVNAGNYSISTWFDNLDMQDVDVKGKFTGYFIFFLILFVGVAGLTKVTGMELASPGIALGLVLAVAWIASLGGFFTIIFSPSDFINKYGIVLVITFLCAGFTLGQLRKT